MLQRLDLTRNDLDCLPDFMGELRRIEFIYAQHNNIRNLPNFTGCDALKEIHLANNFIVVSNCYQSIVDANYYILMNSLTFVLI